MKCWIQALAEAERKTGESGPVSSVGDCENNVLENKWENWRAH